MSFVFLFHSTKYIVDIFYHHPPIPAAMELARHYPPPHPLSQTYRPGVLPPGPAGGHYLPHSPYVSVRLDPTGIPFVDWGPLVRLCIHYFQCDSITLLITRLSTVCHCATCNHALGDYQTVASQSSGQVVWTGISVWWVWCVGIGTCVGVTGMLACTIEGVFGYFSLHTSTSFYIAFFLPPSLSPSLSPSPPPPLLSLTPTSLHITR